jgi:hypothetical protein
MARAQALQTTRRPYTLELMAVPVKTEGASPSIRAGATALDKSDEASWRLRNREKSKTLIDNSPFKSIERDAQLLANRIALLKQEEMRTWKKIEETKKRATEVLTLKQKNEIKI